MYVILSFLWEPSSKVILSFHNYDYTTDEKLWAHGEVCWLVGIPGSSSGNELPVHWGALKSKDLGVFS